MLKLTPYFLKTMVALSAVFIAPILSATTLSDIKETRENSVQLIILTSFSEEVSSTLAAEFERQNPNLRVRFLHKKTPAALTHLQLKMQPLPDLVMASAVDAMDWLSRADLLQPYRPKDRLNYTPFGYSGYGYMWDTNYLKQHKLPLPSSWESLLEEKYQGHIAMSSPMRSGTTHVIVEIILQELGWREGWAYLQQLAGNLATVTARSFGVRQGVLRKRFGLGLVIDSFAFSAQNENSAIGFRYSSPTTFLPVSIGIVKQTTQAVLAKKFVTYLLSDTGQQILLKPNISRYPINNEQLLQHPKHLLNSYRHQQKHTLDYDHTLAVRRYHLVNALFEYTITYRLPFLQQAWRKIYRLQQQLANRNSLLLNDQLEALVKDLKTIPFKEIQLGNSLLLSQFSKPIPGSALSPLQAQLQHKWRQWDVSLQDKIMRKLQQLEVAITTMEHP